MTNIFLIKLKIFEIEGTAQCPSQVMLAAALGCEELGISNKLLAQSVFGLWMASSLLEIQLKPHHRPYAGTLYKVINTEISVKDTAMRKKNSRQIQHKCTTKFILQFFHKINTYTLQNRIINFEYSRS